MIFNDHITTLLISDQTWHMLYRQYKKKSKRRLESYMSSAKDKKTGKNISHLLFNRYIYTEMETLGMINL